MPTLRHTNGGTRDIGNKMIVGRAKINARKSTAFGLSVRFGTYFHSDSRPIVLTQLLSTVETTMFQIRTTALDGTHNINSQGFIVRGNNYSASSKKKNYVNNFYIDYAAFAW